MAIRHHHERHTKLWMLISEAEVLIQSGLKSLCGGDQRAENMLKINFVSAHVDDCLIACKSAAAVTMFKKELLIVLSVQMRVRLLNIWDVN